MIFNGKRLAVSEKICTFADVNIKQEKSYGKDFNVQE